MPENGRPSDEEKGGVDPRKSAASGVESSMSQGGEAITATLTGAVEQVSKDVRDSGAQLVDAVDHAVGDAAGEAADALSHGIDAASETPSPEAEEHTSIAKQHTNGAAQVAVAATAGKSEAKPARSRLRDAMRKARQSEVERNDVIVDLRETELARLDLLAESVEDVFGDIPESTDLFDGQVTPGDPPRLWIDVLAYVGMARDKRTYQFVQETRHGRKVVSETGSVDSMSQQVTQYIAHRMIERERALSSDQSPAALAEDERVRAEYADEKADNGKSVDADATASVDATETTDTNADAGSGVSGAAVAKSAAAAGAAATGAVRARVADKTDDGRPGYSGFALIVAFMLGMVAGAIALFLIGANYVPPA
jgi:hypothetical protein